MVEVGEEGSIPKEAMESIILAPGEEKRKAWKASYKYPPPLDAPNSLTIGGMSGFPLLTNRRVAFLASKGLLSPKYFVALSIDLEDVLGVDCSGPSHVHLSYKGSRTTAILSDFMELSGPTDNVLMDRGPSIPSSEIKNILCQLIKNRLHEIEEEHHRTSTKIVLDFSFLKSMLEEGGIMVQSMKCPACGANIDLPKSGETVRCDYCGSNVRAIDLLERIRELIVGLNARDGN